MWRCFIVTIGTAALSACGNLSARPPVPEALQETVQSINASLASVPHVNESDLLGDESGHRYRVSASFIRDKQCSSGSANPMILVARPVKINLRGSIEESGTIVFSDVAPAETAGGAKPSQKYGFEVPLRVSAVADLPNEYLKEMSALLETKGLPPETAEKLKKDLPETYERLVARVDKLVNDFHPSVCPRVVAQRKRERVRSAILALPRSFVPPTF